MVAWRSVWSNGTTLGRVAGVRGASVTSVNLDRVGFDVSARAHPVPTYLWIAVRWAPIQRAGQAQEFVVPCARQRYERGLTCWWAMAWPAIEHFERVLLWIDSEHPAAEHVMLGARVEPDRESRIYAETLEAGREKVSVNQVDGPTLQALVPGRWWRGRFDACGGIETDRSSTQAWRP